MRAPILLPRSPSEVGLRGCVLQAPSTIAVRPGLHVQSPVVAATSPRRKAVPSMVCATTASAVERLRGKETTHGFETSEGLSPDQFKQTSRLSDATMRVLSSYARRCSEERLR